MESSDGSELSRSCLVGLSQIEYNGHVCHLMGENGDRIMVRVDGLRNPIKVKPENIVPTPGKRTAPRELCMMHGNTDESVLHELLSLASPKLGEMEELLDLILSFLKVPQVDSSEIVALGASSTAPFGPSSAENTLKPEGNSWWISASGSCPRGVGREWVAYQLSPAAAVRIEYLALTIPALPHGPLSVRVFHLESAAHVDGPWVRCTDDLYSLDSGDVQEWALSPPVEAQLVRIVCCVNANAYVRQQQERRGEIPQFTQIHADQADCIGFFWIAFR